MEKINLIEFNENSVESISYNGVDLGTLIYNNSYRWDKNSASEPIYLVGMSTSSDGSGTTNGILDKTTGQVSGPMSLTFTTGERVGVSGPTAFICKTTTERSMRFLKYQYDQLSGYVIDDNELDFNSDSCWIGRSYVEDFGYIFYTKKSVWTGGDGGETYYRLILNETSGVEDSGQHPDRRIYRFDDIVDENNHWFFEDFDTSKIVKCHSGSSNGEIIFNYYPGTFEAVSLAPSVYKHDYLTGGVTAVDETFVAGDSNGILESVSISKVDYTTFKLTYSINLNSTNKYRDCGIVLKDANDTNVLYITFIQEPDQSNRVYFLNSTLALPDIENTSEFFGDTKICSLGSVKTVDNGVTVELYARGGFAIPSTAQVTVKNTSGSTISPIHLGDMSWGDKQYSVYYINSNGKFSLTITS